MKLLRLFCRKSRQWCDVKLSLGICRDIDTIAKDKNLDHQVVLMVALQAGLELFLAENERDAVQVYENYYKDQDGENEAFFI